MNWLHAFIWFAIGTFVGPWLLAMVTGKGKQSANSGY